MGVLSSRCTTNAGLIDRLTAEHPTAFTSNCCQFRWRLNRQGCTQPPRKTVQLAGATSLYEHTSVVITTNLDFAEWSRVFIDV
jgi:hypothetical protein